MACARRPQYATPMSEAIGKVPGRGCVRDRFRWIRAEHARARHGDAVRSCIRSGRIVKRRGSAFEGARTARILPRRIVRTLWRCRDDRARRVNGPVLGVRENVVNEQTLKIGTMRGPSSRECPCWSQRKCASSRPIGTTNSLSTGYSRRSPENTAPGLACSNETVMENIAARGRVILCKRFRQLAFSKHCNQANQQIIDGHSILPMLQLHRRQQRD